MREAVQEDKSSFYTYAKAHLSLNFPVVDVHDYEAQMKMQSVRNWRTAEGFDIRDKNANLNEHPRKPHNFILDEL